MGIVGADQVELGGTVEQPNVLQPADRGGCGVHLPVRAVGRAPIDPPGGGDGQPCRGPGRNLTQVGQQERAGAERALRLPGFEAALRQQGGLLVHHQAPDRNRRAERTRLADDLVVGGNPRHPFALQVEQAEEFVVVADLVQRGDQRPAGGGHVRDHLAGQLVQDPGVGGGDHPFGGDVAAQPRQLGRGEVRIEHQPGALGDQVGLVGDRIAHALGPAVLPHHHR